MAYIKTEIKEEVEDFSEGVPYSDQSSLSRLVKSEDDEIEYFEFDESEEHTYIPVDDSSSSNADDNAKSETSHRNNMQCEDVCVDDEPEIYITNFNEVVSKTNADASDPLSLFTTINQPFPCKEAQTTSIIDTLKTPPVKDLVSRTYSSKYRKITTQKYHCKVCNKLYMDKTQLGMPAHSCTMKFQQKCKFCEFISYSKQNLLDHESKCRLRSRKLDASIKSYGQIKVKYLTKPSEPTKPVTKPSERSKPRKIKLNANVNFKECIDTYKYSKRTGKSCDICLIEISSAEELALHQKTNHLIANAYACHLCDRKFDSCNETIAHLRDTHKTR